MKFEGNLSKFFPPDLLLFLANLGKEGVLTVTHHQEFLTVSFKDGALIDAHSSLADEKILRSLYIHKFIDNKQYKYIFQARKETGIRVIQILEKLNLFSIESIRDMIDNGIKEVLFQFFLLKSGQFKFSDILVDQHGYNKSWAPQAVAMEISRWVDEWQEIERTMTSFDRRVTVSPNGGKAENPGYKEKIILSLIRGERTINDIVTLAPIPSFAALKAIEKSLANGWLKLQPVGKKTNRNKTLFGTDELFSDYKKAFKKIIDSDEVHEKVKRLIGFCKDHFEQTFIISATEDKLLRCVVFFKDQNGNLKSRDIRNIAYNIDDDPVFSRVFRSGFAFFGNLFATGITQGLVELPSKGECAVIPLGKKGGRANLIYVVSTGDVAEVSPFHYLELLSWLINPTAENAQWSPFSKQQDTRQTKGTTPPSLPPARPDDKARHLADVIDELPPMPHLATKTLDILSDPDSSISDLTNILAQDQSMMATLIKVSNSVLYRSGHEITTLNDAVTRLGLKTIRSLVLTATTHSLFPKNKAGFGILIHSLWQHSKECGLASRRVAEAINHEDPEEAFVGGLLHDIGKLAIFLKFTDKYSRIIKKQSAEGIASMTAEKEILGFDHTEIGVLLMEKWKLPGTLLACVKNHHRTEESERFKTLTDVITLGNYLSHLYGTQVDDTLSTKMPPEITEIRTTFNLSKKEEKTLHEAVISDFKHSHIFD